MKPVSSKLLIELVLPETKTKSGIILTETPKEDIVTGVVTQVGTQVTEVNVGDMVWLSRYAFGDSVKPEIGSLMLIEEEDILVKGVKDEETS